MNVDEESQTNSRRKSEETREGKSGATVLARRGPDVEFALPCSNCIRCSLFTIASFDPTQALKSVKAGLANREERYRFQEGSANARTVDQRVAVQKRIPSNFRSTLRGHAVSCPLRYPSVVQFYAAFSSWPVCHDIYGFQYRLKTVPSLSGVV